MAEVGRAWDGPRWGDLESPRLQPGLLDVALVRVPRERLLFASGSSWLLSRSVGRSKSEAQPGLKGWRNATQSRWETLARSCHPGAYTQKRGNNGGQSCSPPQGSEGTGERYSNRFF